MVEVKQAPELPKGYFFRVKRGVSQRYVVELRREIVGRVITKRYDWWPTDYAGEVYRLMEKLKGQLEDSIEMERQEDKFYGDYPPKKNVGGEG